MIWTIDISLSYDLNFTDKLVQVIQKRALVANKLTWQKL